MKKSKLLIATLLITTILAMPLTSLASVDFVSPYTFSIPSLTSANNQTYNKDGWSYTSDFNMYDNGWMFVRESDGLTFSPETLEVVDKTTGETVTKYNAAKAADNSWLVLNQNFRPGSSANKLSMQFDMKVTEMTDDFIYDVTDTVKTAQEADPAADISSLYDYTIKETVNKTDEDGNIVYEDEDKTIPVTEEVDKYYYKKAQPYLRYTDSAKYVQYSKDIDAGNTATAPATKPSQDYMIQTIGSINDSSSTTISHYLSIWLVPATTYGNYAFTLLVDNSKTIIGTSGHQELWVGRNDKWLTVTITADIDTKTIDFTVYNQETAKTVLDLTFDTTNENVATFFDGAVALSSAGQNSANRYSYSKLKLNNIKYTTEMYDINTTDITESGDNYVATVNVANNMSNRVDASGNNSGTQFGDLVTKTPVVLMAAYNDNMELVSIDVKGEDAFESVRKTTNYITPLTSDDYNVYEMSVPKGADGTNAKLFVWKSMSNISPLIKAKLYPAAE